MLPQNLPSLRSALSGAVLAVAFSGFASAFAAEPVPTKGFDETGMNRAVAPGDDFYAYANGSWVDRTEIPGDRGSWSIFSLIAERTNPQILALIEAAAKDRAHATPAGRLAADFHTAYMDEAGIEAHGLAPLQPKLREIAQIADKAALARALGGTVRADVDVMNATQLLTENIFGLWVTQGLNDPQHYLPYLLQGGLGMPDRAYYLTESPRMAEIRAKYQTHVARVLGLAGFADADARAARIFALERKLAQAHATTEETFDVLKANNPWRREEFATKAPGMDWDAFFAGASLMQPPVFIVWHPRAITGVAALVASEPLADWRDYLAFHTLNRLSDVLPKVFADARFAFYGTALTGTPQQAARSKRALAAANLAIGDAVGQLYTARYFPPESKAKAQAMVANIVRAFDQRIQKLVWMNPATQEQARAKLKVLYVGIGYPDKWTDYTGLAIDPADALGNVVRAAEFRYRQRVALLGGPVNPTEWCMTAQEVNAVNMPMQNALNFPAAILQPPFFDPAAPDAFNYGAIGVVIGHEISHSFDDQGSQFDSQGRLRDWWTPDDLAHFKASAAALVAQYNGYHAFPDLALNGQQTLGENLADLAGLAAAYDGYRAAVGAAVDDKLFFHAFAQNWRSKYREPQLRRQVLTDGHSPGSFRALTVRNLDAWYETFGVQPGQSLYLAPADRVRVW
ncbi:MAG: M13 family metallopeptidase [Opitutae bacterium]|nr:M13 family metallopeptidase [Opitutae bacterium]